MHSRLAFRWCRCHYCDGTGYLSCGNCVGSGVEGGGVRAPAALALARSCAPAACARASRWRQSTTRALIPSRREKLQGGMRRIHGHHLPKASGLLVSVWAGLCAACRPAKGPNAAGHHGICLQLWMLCSYPWSHQGFERGVETSRCCSCVGTHLSTSLHVLLLGASSGWGSTAMNDEQET